MSDALVTTAWLADHLDDPDLRVIDATWYMPNVGRTGRQDYVQRHIPGAVFWDIDAIADQTSKLPHMLPRAQRFGQLVGQLGIGNDTRVVAYDATGVSSAAARAWWMLRAFGHDKVSVLDGGLPKWLAENRPVTDAETALQPKTFNARFRPELVRALEQVRANIKDGKDQVLDARSAGRFAGTEAEPRPGLRSGHIPGSRNLPHTELWDPKTKTMLPPAQLARKFAAAGIDTKKPVVTSCGSGVTACVLALGLYQLGANAAVYDGSWTEWGGRSDTPIAP